MTLNMIRNMNLDIKYCHRYKHFVAKLVGVNNRLTICFVFPVNNPHYLFDGDIQGQNKILTVFCGEYDLPSHINLFSSIDKLGWFSGPS